MHAQEFPDKILFESKLINDRREMAETFNKYFLKIGPKLAQKIDQPTDYSFASNCDADCVFEESELRQKELDEAFASLKLNKSAGHDDMNVNVMGECNELQEEELEVLQSIFEGDEAFKVISPKCFQYKYGEDDSKSFVLEISWEKNYPMSLPNVNLDLFHNGYLPSTFKEEIKSKLLEQASSLLESAMTYSLFDWMKENADDYLNRIPELVLFSKKIEVATEETNDVLEENVKKEKKEQLTKAQKRRITEQTNYKGERERGWNWVDIVKHLSQSGSQVV